MNIECVLAQVGIYLHKAQQLFTHFSTRVQQGDHSRAFVKAFNAFTQIVNNRKSAKEIHVARRRRHNINSVVYPCPD